MSSLAAARADNFYHPPDWDPRKESRAQHSNNGPKWKAHPLRERAKKLDQGILVIRFEMPFDVRCSGCGCRIAKGVRFDAEKKAVGKYLSTKIWSFRMLCKAEQEGNALCDQKRNPHFIEVRTDPKNAAYIVTEGAQVLHTSTATAAELGVEVILDPKELAARAADPFYKLEAHAPQQAQAKARKAWLPALEEARGELWQDDYAASQAVRAAHRSKRKAALLTESQHEALGLRISLLPEETSDSAAAAAAFSGSAPGAAKRTRTDAGSRRAALHASSIFEERRASAEEVKRLQLLQLRRRRGIQLAPTSVAKAAKAGGAPPPRAAPVRVASRDGGEWRAGARGAGAAARAEGGRGDGAGEGASGAASSSASSPATAPLLSSPTLPPATQAGAQGVAQRVVQGAVLQGVAARQDVGLLQGLVAYSDSDSEGES